MENSISSDGRLEIKFDTSQLESDMDAMQKRFESLGLSAIESSRVIQASYGAAAAAASAYMEGVSESFMASMASFKATLADTEALCADVEAALSASEGLNLNFMVISVDEARAALDEQRESVAALESEYNQLQGVISGVEGLSGALSAAAGFAELLGQKSEALEKIQTKLQSVMTVLNGVLTVHQTLQQSSAFRTTTLIKITELWSMANAGLSKAFVGLGLGIRAADIAAKAFAATLTLGISVAITGLMYLVDQYIDKQKEQEQAAAETAQKVKEYNEGIAQSASQSVAKVELLAYSWSQLSSEAEKMQFIEDNQKAFNDLGFSISSVNDANNLLINNKGLVVEAFIAQATAAAAMNVAIEKAKDNISKGIELDAVSKQIQDQQKLIAELEVAYNKAAEDEKSMYDKSESLAPLAKQSVAQAQKDLNAMLNKETIMKVAIEVNEKDIEEVFNKMSKSSDEAKAKMKAAGMQTPEEIAAIKKQEQDKQDAAAKAAEKAAAAAEKAARDELARKKRIAEQIKKATEDLANEAYAIEFKAQERAIALMEDGAAKRLTINELNYKKEMRALTEWKQKQVALYNELAKAKAIEAAGEKGSKAAKKAEADYVPVATFDEVVNKEEGNRVVGNATILSPEIAVEGTQRFQDINAELAAENAKLLEEYSRSWAEWASESEKIDNEIVATKKKAAADIANVEAMVSSGAIASDEASKLTAAIKSGSENKIKVLESSGRQMSDDWTRLFTDLDSLSNKGIRELIKSINSQLSDTTIDLPAAETEALLGKLKDAQDKLAANNPFGQLANGVKRYKEASEAASKAAEGSAEKAKAEGDKKAAREEMGKAVSASAGMASEGLGAVTGLLGELGVETPPIVEGIMGSLDAVAQIDWKNPFSIVIGGIKAITSIIGGIFDQADARIQKQMAATQKAIEESNKQIEDLQKASEDSYGYDKASKLLEAGEEYKKQLEEIDKTQKMIDEEGKDNKKNKERLAELNAQEKEIQESYEETKQKAQDAIFGEELKSAISNFSSSYMDSWNSGELDQDFGKKMVDNMIKQVVSQMLNGKVAEKMEMLRTMIDSAMSDGVLTEDEYAEINAYANGIKSDLDSVTQGFEMLQDSRETLNEVSGKGFEGITQETGGKLDGKFTLMLENQFMINAEIINIKDLINNNISSIVSNLNRIADNTDKLSKLDSIEDNSNYMRKKVDSVITNTGRIRIVEENDNNNTY